MNLQVESLKADHPITPPWELLKQWEDDWFDEREHADVLLIQAFQAGADQELEACCEWFKKEGWNSCHPEALVATRRPKSLSLKEQALEALDRMWTGGSTKGDWELFRRALEALPD